MKDESDHQFPRLFQSEFTAPLKYNVAPVGELLDELLDSEADEFSEAEDEEEDAAVHTALINA
ncbi:hypothetical protein EBZ39_03945 [bacterium]|nr:hypothetical protein [bacterium]